MLKLHIRGLILSKQENFDNKLFVMDISSFWNGTNSLGPTKEYSWAFPDTVELRCWIINSPDGETLHTALQEVLRFSPPLSLNFTFESFLLFVGHNNEKKTTQKIFMRMENMGYAAENMKYRLFILRKGLYYTVGKIGSLKFCFRFKLFCFSSFPLFCFYKYFLVFAFIYTLSNLSWIFNGNDKQTIDIHIMRSFIWRDMLNMLHMKRNSCLHPVFHSCLQQSLHDLVEKVW